jgi:glycosyltransferase involved in cell wall biosynthesis
VRVCFYAAVSDPALFQLVEFYRQDIRALRDLGHEVELANTPSHLAGRWEAAWVWWQTSGVPAVLVARARRRPCVLVSALSDRDPSASGMSRKSVPARWAASASLRLADLVLAASVDTYAGLAPYRTRALWTAPLGVDTDMYRPRYPQREPLVLTISHLTADNVKRKRLLDVVRVAAAVPGVRFKLVGEELDGAAAVRSEIASLGLADRFDLVGRISAQEKCDLLARATAYLQPTEYEAFGMAIAEAMASGAVVLSNAIGNVPELVGNAGILVPQHAGPDALAAALRHVLARPQQLETLGRRARQRIERHFSATRRTELVAEALTEVTAGGR